MGLYSTLAPSFKYGHMSMMVWSVFRHFNKCLLVIIPLDRKTTSDFVTLVYEETLSGFYFLYDHLKQLTLMEDGAPIHCNLLL